jgi:hypothetical protein
LSSIGLCMLMATPIQTPLEIAVGDRRFRGIREEVKVWVESLRERLQRQLAPPMPVPHSTTLGAICTLTMLVGLARVLVGGEFAPDTTDLAHRVALRAALCMLSEAPAVVFFRLYVRRRDDIKYFNNELTNIRARSLAVRTALAIGDKEALRDSLHRLVEADRNSGSRRVSEMDDRESSGSKLNRSRRKLKWLNGATDLKLAAARKLRLHRGPGRQPIASSGPQSGWCRHRRVQNSVMKTIKRGGFYPVPIRLDCSATLRGSDDAGRLVRSEELRPGTHLVGRLRNAHETYQGLGWTVSALRPGA